MTTILEVRQIHKSFNSLRVLKDVSFTVSHKEIVGIIGPSGGGKTTLLRCLNALEIVDSGEILWKMNPNSNPSAYRICKTPKRQADGSKMSELRKMIGVVFQHYNLWEDRNVLDNLILAPRVVLRLSKRDAVTKAKQLLAQFDLESKSTSQIRSLSGGQRQRVAIIRSMMMDPQVMLLDEITSALDPILAFSVMQSILKLREQGLTMLIVTHHIEFASTLCDRIMYIADGEIVQFDTPEIILNDPKSKAMREFVQILRATR